jgi:hypothetical protein
MGRRYWIAAVLFLGVLATIAVAGMKSAEPRLMGWEYGMYVSGVGEDGKKRVSWYDAERYVSNYSPYEFCRNMNIPASNTKVDEMALTPVFELTVFNDLGEKGWELVSFPEKKSGSTTYLFKRPKAKQSL